MVACAKSETSFHALTGNRDTFKEEQLGGEHKICITAAISSTVAAIQELLEYKPQLWICSGCRLEEGHVAMNSTVTACTDCGETMASTLLIYVSAWVRGLLTKSFLGTDTEKGNQLTNFSHFGALLLAPHGVQNGLEYPDHTEMGDFATCACESQEVEIIDPKGTDADAGVDGNVNPVISVENMETEEIVALPAGADSLVKKFARSTNPKSLLELVEGDYNQDLLSKRLQGNAMKEGLIITLLRQFRAKDPNFKPPAWMPKELLSVSEEAMEERMSFLRALSKKPTQKEKKGQANDIHPGLTSSKIKRKLPSTAGEDLDRRPAKQQKTFTTTPEEMVKIFGQYMQAQGANFDRRVQPARVMENIIERVEGARRSEQVTVAVPSTAQVQPLMTLRVEAPAQATQPTAAPAPSASTGNPLVVNPLFAASHPEPAQARGGGGRGRGWGWRGRGGQGGDVRGGASRSWLADRPVRCPKETSPGSFCGFPNYREAEKCGGCGFKNPYHKSLVPNSNPQQTNQRGGQGNWRGRGQGYRHWQGRRKY